jgi:3-hydroxy-D-aspartate aldolase
MSVNRDLIGRQGGKQDLSTPALALDLDAFEANIARMAARAASRGVALRPHAKTHKCAAVARAQIAAGAVGVCCAKLGEAEALTEAGIDNILITSPVAGARAIERLKALAGRARGLKAVIDDPALLPLYAGGGLDLVIDIDPGLHRTGVPDAAAAVELARAVAATPAVRYAGVQFYCGAQQHIADVAERRTAIAARTDYLRSVIAALTEAGFPPALVTGGGTGTHQIDLELGVLNELQVGSYGFMDSQYEDCEAVDFAPALMVLSRVVSARHQSHVTVDAGLKAFATEAGPPRLLGGAAEGSRYRFMGDEHGALIPPEGEPPAPLDALIAFAPPHCDPTVNLYDDLHVLRGDTLVDIWPIEARGRSA